MRRLQRVFSGLNRHDIEARLERAQIATARQRSPAGILGPSTATGT